MNDIEFKVGQEHENMKGVYKVLAVNKDTLSICWESGEEVSTTVALQNRIIERMQRERVLIRGKRGGKGKKPALPEYVTKFEGLKEADFSEDVAGATWRHYDGLGGAVAVRVNSDKFDITSWPRYGLSEIYWADLNQQSHNDFRIHAKFFVRLDENRLHCGLSIGRSDEEMNARVDWNAFIDWLRDAGNESWLKEVISKHEFSIYDIGDGSAFAWTVMSAGGKWRLSNEGQEEEIESLGDFLSSLADSTWVDLQIAKIIEKDEVVSRGVEIADDISRLFELLMPLYEASVVPD